MDTFLSVALSLSTLALGLVAIGGETWNEAGNKISEKITIRGWIAIFFLIISFALTIIIDMRADRDQMRLAESSKILQDKQNALGLISEDLRQKQEQVNIQQKEIGLKTKKIEDLQREIVTLSRRMEGQLSQNRNTLSRQTRSIRSKGIVLRTNRKEPTNLRVFAEDVIQYTMLISDEQSNDSLFQGESALRVFLEAGGNQYPLSPLGGRVQIFGTPDQIMNLYVVKDSGPDELFLKISLESTRDEEDYSYDIDYLSNQVPIVPVDDEE